MFEKIGIPVIAVLGIVCISFLGFDQFSAEGEIAAVKKTIQEDEKIVSSATAYDPVVVVELFTSQGCSSCPPADALLQTVKKQFPDKVFALSYHVDYWNYIGWKDPFSKPQFSTKQGFYNRKFNYSSNYTPEAVVNGKEHFVGSSGSKMAAKIRKYGTENAENKIVLSNVALANGKVSFNYDLEGVTSGKLLRAILVLDEKTTAVKRGENRNRTLTNTNIVVSEKYLSDPKKVGQSSITVPPIVSSSDDLTLMLLIETDNLDITGAAKAKV